jgi:hypothetical protein
MLIRIVTLIYIIMTSIFAVTLIFADTGEL